MWTEVAPQSEQKSYSEAKLTPTERVLLPEYGLPATRQLDVELWVVLNSRVVLFPVCTVVRETTYDAVRMKLTRPSCTLRRRQASPCGLAIACRTSLPTHIMTMAYPRSHARTFPAQPVSNAVGSGHHPPVVPLGSHAGLTSWVTRPPGRTRQRLGACYQHDRDTPVRIWPFVLERSTRAV